jgi:hypothetical protein
LSCIQLDQAGILTSAVPCRPPIAVPLMSLFTLSNTPALPLSDIRRMSGSMHRKRLMSFQVNRGKQ